MKKALRISVAIMFLSIISLTAIGQVEWEKHPDPVLDSGPDEWDNSGIYRPEVMFDGTQYKMWYTGGGPSGTKIGYATSPDGIVWQKYANNPVLDAGPDDWDNVSVFKSEVMFDGTEYKMWYAGNNGSRFRIGYATSPDGISWQKHPNNPVLNTGTGWESMWISSPEVIFDGTEYKMWYIGYNGGTWRIGHATSPDGIVWEKYANNPVLKTGSWGTWDDTHIFGHSVLSDGTEYKMWYSGDDNLHNRIGYATSADGVVWEKYPDNPILGVGENGTWDDHYVHMPDVLFDGTEYKMWYSGHDDSRSRIGYATSVADEVVQPETPKDVGLKWAFQTGERAHSSPAIGNKGTIFIGSLDGNLYAVNSDGTEKWRFETGMILAAPAIGSNGTIYIVSGDNYIRAINPDGTEKWRFNAGSRFLSSGSSPAIGADGTIYVGSWDGVQAINSNGTEKWQLPTKNEVWSSPAIGADDTVYIGARDFNLYAINSDGTEKWRFWMGDWVESSPAIGADGTLYVGSLNGNLYAIHPNGTEKWTFQTGNSIASSPAIGADGTVYVGSYDNNIYAINPDGTEKWRFETGDNLYSSPAIGADGTIYLGSWDGNLYAINSDGTEKWRFETENKVLSSPSIGNDGTIYVGSDDGNLYAIGSNSGGLADSSWPMFRHDVRHTGRVGASFEPLPEIPYSIVGDEGDVGGVIIPSKFFPEGQNNVIPLHIPSLIDGSNLSRNENGWRTIKEIEQRDVSFAIEELPAHFVFAVAITPAGAAFSAIAGLIKAFKEATYVSECKILVQSDLNNNFRAIIEVGDHDRRTFFRKCADQGWNAPLADAFWTVRAVFSREIAENFDLEPGDFPNKYYTALVRADAAHKDDIYIGYLSLSQEGALVITPKIYPDDGFKVLRVHEFIIPYKKETVVEFAGDELINFLEGPADLGFIKMLSPFFTSGSAIVAQGKSPIEIRVYDSQDRVTGMINGKVKEDIPNSICDREQKIVMILSPSDVYRYEVMGTDNGSYGLELTSLEQENIKTFLATKMPTSPKAVHKYTVDWNILYEGEKGVTVQVDNDGDGTAEHIITADAELTPEEYSSATGVTPHGRKVITWGELRKTDLLQNYPNPFNPETWIPYKLAELSEVTVCIFSATGELIRQLNLGRKRAGFYLSKNKATYWDGLSDSGEQVASGVYFYTLQAGEFTEIRKMVIAR